MMTSSADHHPLAGERVSFERMPELDQGEADVHHPVRDGAGHGQDQVGSGLGDQDVQRQEADGRPQEGGQRDALRRAEAVEADRDDSGAAVRARVRASATW